ncbi:alpha/beta hydrolase family protein [Nitrospirillum iridis]|uniref:Putative dienelactone hydrolase n=1 Tax=Nitrospirillum iridis TaxID=765888 RepID=A0A7X0B1Z1_9PROT|nr:prolyl oligopeptidase family serine peptidase [Nitrospirillum iridis]MBB6254242.1 putative dienelactone hydrolase [Nitrospirillum iridis]
MFKPAAIKSTFPSSAAALFALALSCLSLLPAPASAAVGFRWLSMPDGQDAAVEVAMWYPTDAAAQPTQVGPLTRTVALNAPLRGGRLPLIVISHGNGGNAVGHADTAEALAEAGFVVAALTHTGDNVKDQSRAADVANRPRQLSLLISYMIATWADAVDPARIGAFGFSAGGYTVLAAAGGRPDLNRIGPHCAAHPEFYDCRLIAAHLPDGGLPRAIAPPRITPDARIRAIVAAAPALGFAFADDGLAAVRVPVQLWRAEDDEILPHPYYAEAVRLALPQPPETHVVPHARHFDFLVPCSAILEKTAPQICQSEEGFDRSTFHQRFDAEIVAFFRKTL